MSNVSKTMLKLASLLYIMLGIIITYHIAFRWAILRASQPWYWRHMLQQAHGLYMIALGVLGILMQHRYYKKPLLKRLSMLDLGFVFIVWRQRSIKYTHLSPCTDFIHNFNSQIRSNVVQLLILKIKKGEQRNFCSPFAFFRVLI